MPKHKHDDELCMCQRCIARLIDKHDRHLAAWLAEQNRVSSSARQEGRNG